MSCQSGYKPYEHRNMENYNMSPSEQLEDISQPPHWVYVFNLIQVEVIGCPVSLLIHQQTHTTESPMSNRTV